MSLGLHTFVVNCTIDKQGIKSLFIFYYLYKVFLGVSVELRRGSIDNDSKEFKI